MSLLPAALDVPASDTAGAQCGVSCLALDSRGEVAAVMTGGGTLMIYRYTALVPQ